MLSIAWAAKSIAPASAASSAVSIVVVLPVMVQALQSSPAANSKAKPSGAMVLLVVAVDAGAVRFATLRKFCAAKTVSRYVSLPRSSPKYTLHTLFRCRRCVSCV
ncbi:hypothetical protein Gdia_2673 [Gluconacetobacter diazotrophicus PA1 5]|nr:hypothetical protein Gdia_2673 [Gluconacetobacter diazotrophicus PA1 5]TWA98196.1 hypothetical protein FBZ86_1503 [Gluconacetobacter diazotrophicus]